MAYTLALISDYWPDTGRHYYWPHFRSGQTETQSGEVTSAGGPAGNGARQNPLPAETTCSAALSLMPGTNLIKCDETLLPQRILARSK